MKLGVLVLSVLLLAAGLLFCTRHAGSTVCTDDKGAMDYCPEYVYGFNLDSVDISYGEIQKNDFLSTLLTKQGLAYDYAMKLCAKAQPYCPANQIRSGKPYAFVHASACDEPDYFIYEPSQYRYVVFDLRENADVTEIKRPIDTVRREVSGMVSGSLWLSMDRQDISPAIIDRMEDALGYSVDFYHIQNGDRFKLIYDELYIDGERVGVGDLYAALYETAGQQYYAILYETDKYHGYFDEEARPMKKAFLKSPIRYGRISSRYNLKRFHPVLKRTKPHLGTDYAAPTGTEIYAVANGTVTHVAYTRGNGKYVKIKHDDVYTTQYLHMSRHAKGLKPGHKVKQGQLIGYVGQTGLATGPHVCFRFWKNGRQVNHLRENLPPPEPMAKDLLPAYFKIRDRMKRALDKIEYRADDAPQFVDKEANPEDQELDI